MYKNIISALFLFPIFFACTDFRQPNTTNVLLNINEPQAPIKSTKPDEGKSIFMTYCLSCHQKDASGVPGMFPPLQNNKVIIGDKKKIISIVLNGLQGEIEVDGEVYNQTMPPQNYLTNKQIAKVLSFLRQNFGNKADSVKEKDVSAIRPEK